MHEETKRLDKLRQNERTRREYLEKLKKVHLRWQEEFYVIAQVRLTDVGHWLGYDTNDFYVLHLNKIQELGDCNFFIVVLAVERLAKLRNELIGSQASLDRHLADSFWLAFLDEQAAEPAKHVSVDGVYR